MATYSHSRISTYENCPYQYKLRYIDRVKVDVPTTIEAFMGDMVHQTLEFLYKNKKFKKRVAKNILIKFYRDLWEKNYSEDILIVKAEKEKVGADNYRKMGEKFISDYYDRMKPFDQITILGLETTDRMTLPDGNQWHVRIDKLGCDDKGNYFVCDYKTNARMKDQEEADSDRQLALYSVWVKDKFKDAKSVKLIWHMLAFNKDAVSERSEEQLKKLQQEVVDKIKEIENTKEFPRNQTALCDYCVYKEMCPSFKHEAELEKIEDIKKFKENEGVQLVDEFSEIKTKLSDEQKELINFNKHLLKQFTEEDENITILSLSKKVGLSYRAVYKRVSNLLKGKILFAGQDDKSRGKPVILKINPPYEKQIRFYLQFEAETPQEEKEREKEFLNDPYTVKILKGIKQIGKPVNIYALHEKVPDYNFESLKDFLDRLNDYGLIETRHHLTRKGSAFLAKKQPKVSKHFKKQR